jgi:hypothetical protein
MDLHNKICRDHFAWFDKNIASDYGNAPSEALAPMEIKEEAILNYKLKNHLSIDSNVNIDDVYYEGGVISREAYLMNVNAFCDINTNEQVKKVGGVSLRSIDGKNIVC